MPSTRTQTTVTDASQNVAEGSSLYSASNRGVVNVTTADPGIVRDALSSNVAVTSEAIAGNVEGLRISANLVPQFLDAQSRQTADVLRASQENTNLASQIASSGVALARGEQTGGASSLIDSLKPVLIAGVIALTAFFVFRRKAA